LKRSLDLRLELGNRGLHWSRVLNRDFRFDSPIPTPYRLDDLSLQGFSRFWSTVFPAAPGGAGFASGGQRNAGRCPFSERFRRHFSLRPSVVIEICSALRSPYPAGDGSAAIFRSMPANSRRVRWLSASSSQ
jgi:hypothetical protein